MKICLIAFLILGVSMTNACFAQDAGSSGSAPEDNGSSIGGTSEPAGYSSADNSDAESDSLGYENNEVGTESQENGVENSAL